MLQRIQTLFLLIATVFLILMYCYPMAVSPQESIKYSDSTVLFGLLLISTLVEFFIIFLYRRRMVQIRLCIFNLLILIALQLLIVYYLISADDVIFSFTAIFPIVAAIFTFLALRYIGRDEAMVQAAARLRK